MTPETLLLRQIHPSFIQGGRVTSQAFRPTPKDDNKLSVSDGDKCTAQQSWDHFTSQDGCTSCGVMAVARSECTSLELEVIADGVPFPEHVSIDYSAFAKSDIEKKAKALSSKARDRGWLFEEAA